MIEAPWLVNGGHGASLRHHKRRAARAWATTPTATHSPRQAESCCARSDADLTSKDDRLGYLELPLWRLIAPHHMDFASHHEAGSQGLGGWQPPPSSEPVEAVWHTLRCARKRGGSIVHAVRFD